MAALAGFIFGFDTVVISGANLPIKELWHTTPLFHGFLLSMALWGRLSGLFLEAYQQKNSVVKVLLWIGILFSISAVGSAVSPDPYLFPFSFYWWPRHRRFFCCSTTYISEISTAKNKRPPRGHVPVQYCVWHSRRLFLHHLLKGFDGANDWRWMLGVMAIPSLIYTLLVFSVPESPRWLISVK